MTTCVVSAFYRMHSKHSVEKYFEWIIPFLSNCPFQLIFFTEPELLNSFEQIRRKYSSNTILVSLPFSEWNSTKRYGSETWLKQKEKDHETNHSPKLYCTWYEKKEFVMRAIGMRAFDAEYFVWCDAGILRFPEWIPLIQSFPLATKIPKEKMTFLKIADFQKEDTWEKDFQFEDHIGGGIQAAHKDTWMWWYDEYDRMTRYYLEKGKFIGKDQNIIASCYLSNPEKYNLIEPPSFLQGYPRWFWLLLYLSGHSDFS
jgi:hypothetical protein